MARFSYLAAPVAVMGVLGCAAHDPVSVANGVGSSSTKPVAANEAESFLKKSMDAYKGFKSYGATCTWSESFSSQPASQSTKRTFEYAAPNLYKSVTNTKGAAGSFTLASISDGNKVMEYATVKGAGAQTYAAPDSLADASSMIMQHPMFCGTLLYKFFGGSDGYDKLVDGSKGPVKFGNEVKEPEEEARHLKFYATGLYGNADAIIGEKSFKVYEISYDSEPLIQQMQKQGGANAGKYTSAKTQETYADIKIDPLLATSDFAAVAPAGLQVADASAPQSSSDKPVVPLGSKAPDFKVTPLGGGAPVTLASLRGKPVLVDFWATWCPPCRESLPHTQAIFNDLKAKGLQVLVVSNEEAPTIKAFIDKNKYTFPVYQDVNNTAGSTYKVDAIPSVLIIDKDGKLQNYFVGLQDESTLRDALKKVGL